MSPKLVNCSDRIRHVIYPSSEVVAPKKGVTSTHQVEIILQNVLMELKIAHF